MPLLNCENLTKSFGSRTLFQGITLGIDEGERVGLIGPNGSGKSTFLKVLAGEERADRGNIAVRRNLRVGYLPQEERFSAGETVGAVLAEALADQHLDDVEIHLRVEDTVAAAGFPSADQPVSELSGGWRKRLAIAREVIRRPELFLLDEPTNHLDLEGILWLERLLKEANFGCILVSHDRLLLQNAATRIVELNKAYAEGFFSVSGGYADFLEKREEYLAAQRHQQVALQSRVRKEIAWLRQGAKARQTKEQHRIEDAQKQMQSLADVKMRNAAGKTVGIDFDATGRRTKELMLLKGVEKAYGERKLFRNLDLQLSPGMRLGLVGPNGSGKSTLLRLLMGEEEPDKGEVRRADGLRAVYFDQNRESLERSASLRRALAPAGDTVIYQGSPMHVAAWAKRFLFDVAGLEMPVSHLSGGEQARVLLARLMLQPADVLILDEPTNNLDIPTLEVLEESLQDFPGALILVTHDRALIENVCTEILGLDGKGNAGTFADYFQWERVQAERAAREAARLTPPPAAPKPVVQRLSREEQKELSRMEERIEKAETEVATLEGKVADPAVASDHQKLQATWAELQAAQERVAGLYARWEELEARRGGG